MFVNNIKIMEKFIQRINYAHIVPFRNYCLLSEKKNIYGTTFNFDLDNLDDELDSFTVSDNVEDRKNKTLGRLYSLPKSKYKHKCFFTDTDTDSFMEKIDIPYPGKNIGLKDYYTDKSYQIKRHFPDPFSRISVYTYEKSITVTDEKIMLKFYRLTKHRDFNSKYFKRETVSTTLSFNLKNGNFTVGKKENKKSSQIFLRNYFGTTLNDFIYYFFSDIDTDRKIKKSIHEKLDKEFSIDKLISELNKTFGFKLNKNNIKDSFKENLINYFAEKRKIKLPNGDYTKYFTELYPTEKFLKKNNRKLISSVLDMLNFKSKLTIKLLHVYPNIDIISLYMLCNILGPNYSKYVGNLDDICFLSDDDESKISNIKIDILDYRCNFELSDIERENIILVINSMGKPFFDRRNIILLEDHLNMINRVREYEPDIYFKSKTEEDYKKNHRELSKIISTIKKGWSIEYVFAPTTINDVERPITLVIDNTSISDDLVEITPQTISVTFYPYILKREEEYIEEGLFMHHCVASYSNKDRSIIISLRTKDATDRVTCEYNGQDGKLIQSRHFCNGSPPADMEMAIEELTSKVQKYARLGMLHAVEKKKVPVRINGIDVKMERPTDSLYNTFNINYGIFGI